MKFRYRLQDWWALEVMGRITLFLIAISKMFRTAARWAAPVPGFPFIAGGSTGLPVTGEGMTKSQVIALMKETAEEALGPLVTKAFEPFGKAQTDIMQKLLDSARADQTAGAVDTPLGAFPIGRKIAAMWMAKAAGDAECKNTDLAIAEIQKHWRGPAVAPTVKWLQHVKTTMSAGNASTIGDMIQPAYDPEWIRLLRNNAVVRGIARTKPMPRGAASRRRQLTAGTATYQGENDAIAASNLTVGRLALSYKKLTALMVESNDVFRFSSGESDQLIQEDILAICGLREDRACLVGNPPIDIGSPQGMRYQMHADNVFAAAGTSLANFQADLTKLVRLVEDANVPVTTETGYFIMSPGTWWVIFALATTTGDWVFAQMLMQGRLLGYRVLKTTQLSNSQLNTWAGSSGSSLGMIMFAHAPALEIWDSLQRLVEVFPNGAYYDASSAVVKSGISQDETVVRCISEHDFALVYDKAAAACTGYAT